MYSPRHYYYLIHKPFGYLSQFITNQTKRKNQRLLGELGPFPPGTMSVGRLDKDSEGVLLLTTDGKFSAEVTGRKYEKEYYVQVDGKINNEAVERLRAGVEITVNGKAYQTLPAKVEVLDQPPGFAPRSRPVRNERHGPTSWVGITIREGKFRQVRKMTAAVGFPTLRLVRVRIGNWRLDGMASGEWRELEEVVPQDRPQPGPGALRLGKGGKLAGLALLLCLFLCTGVRAQNVVTENPITLSREQTRWKINNNGDGVVWNVAADQRLPHADNIEMSGRGVSMVVEYSVDTNRMVRVQRRMIYPQFRPYIKDTDPAWWATYRNYLRANYEDKDVLPQIYVDEKQMMLPPIDSVVLDGTLTLYHAPHENGLRIVRSFFPSTQNHSGYERLRFFSESMTPVYFRIVATNASREYLGKRGSMETSVTTAQPDKEYFVRKGEFEDVFIDYSGGELTTSPVPGYYERLVKDTESRGKLLRELSKGLVLETPEPIYNTMFSLAKVRGGESIFDSKLGLVHSPGGERYYIGFWANDQAEYINPFFPYLGYNLGNEAALNMWRVYAQAIPEDGSNIRYSFEMEGDSPANPLDRGDAAMIAYGLSHYLLALGDKDTAKELWPLLDWCLEYNHRKLNEYGVVASESDEMEGRIETGDANLATSSLYYGALEMSISLAEELGEDTRKITTLQQRRVILASAIEAYFGRTVEGLETYRYFDGHTALRHWICLPLVVGLHDRKDATLTALFDRLWTDNGVAVEKNHPNPSISKIFWDRGTLYALRGAFVAGGTERAHERLLEFSSKRLLGDRVPYVVEAYPEGSMAHLSAENGLYCRIFTEGVFGILPSGFNSFWLQPRMPAGWDKMALRNIYAFGKTDGFDLEVSRANGQYTVRTIDGKTGKVKEYTVEEGERLEVRV